MRILQIRNELNSKGSRLLTIGGNQEDGAGDFFSVCDLKSMAKRKRYFSMASLSVEAAAVIGGRH